MKEGTEFEGDSYIGRFGRSEDKGEMYLYYNLKNKDMLKNIKEYIRTHYHYVLVWSNLYLHNRSSNNANFMSSEF